MQKSIRITVAALAVAAFFSITVAAVAAKPPVKPPVKPPHGAVQPKHDNKTPPNMKDQAMKDQAKKDQAKKDQNMKDQAMKDQAKKDQAKKQAEIRDQLVSGIKDQVGKDAVAYGNAVNQYQLYPSAENGAQMRTTAAKLDESKRLLDQAQSLDQDKANK